MRYPVLMTMLVNSIWIYNYLLSFAQVLHPIADSININKEIWKMYFDELLPRLVKEGSDSNFGSTALCDTSCLQVQMIFMSNTLAPLYS